MDQKQLDLIVEDGETYLADISALSLKCKGDIPSLFNESVADFNNHYSALAASYGLNYRRIEPVDDTQVESHENRYTRFF